MKARFIGQAVFPDRRLGERLGTGDVSFSYSHVEHLTLRKPSPTPHSQGRSPPYDMHFPFPALRKQNLSLAALGGIRGVDQW